MHRKQKQRCDNLIDNFNKQVENVEQFFNQKWESDKNIDYVKKERFVLLNSQLIVDFLNSKIKFNEYKKLITTVIYNRLNNQLIRLIIYINNYNYTSFNILIIKYILNKYHHLIIMYGQIILTRYQLYYIYYSQVINK
ncbi:unnamed protein product [Paramecium pentaurelia]|uniref:Uncharacterized protein n=1 Tax=Paramecium pentaurelia TaxID=43138 RepID=A0A8S1WZR6_9CILI|nr:unnamed protein product [Paramecium pentaurelia]